MISKGEVITSVNNQNDFIKVMLGTFAVGGHSKYPLGFTFGHSPYPTLPLWNPAEMCEVCECFLVGGEEIVCEDCANYQADDEPDVDEAQEWYDYDPDC